MRVLLVATDYPPSVGGIQSMLREFTVRAKADLRVIAPDHPRAASFDESVPVPVRRVKGIAAAGSMRGYAPGLALSTLNEAKAWEPDVVFAGHVLAAFGGIRLRRSRKIPLVVATYGVELVAPRLRKAAAWVLPRADRVLAVSHFTMEAARKAGARVGRVIPVGAPDPLPLDQARIDAFRSRHGLREAGRVLLTVARLEPHKGIDVVINALSALPPDVQYLVVGRGSSLAAFRAQAQAAGVSDRVIFAGGLDEQDLAAAYRLADVFVLASRSLDGGARGVEGCPVSLLEASAYGKAIVAGRTGGIADAVTDGVTGLLADPESPSDISGALNRALDPKTAKQIGGTAERAAKAERNWSVVVEKMEQLLQEAADDRT